MSAETAYGHLASVTEIPHGRRLRIPAGRQIIFWEPENEKALFSCTSYNHAAPVKIHRIVNIAGMDFAVWGRKGSYRAIAVTDHAFEVAAAA